MNNNDNKTEIIKSPSGKTTEINHRDNSKGFFSREPLTTSTIKPPTPKPNINKGK